MPHSDPPRPRAATCEDWDEHTQDTLPNTETSANVAVKRAQPELSTKASYERRRNGGSDSGYSSKAGTIDSDLSGRMAGLTIRTGVIERERHPYSMPPPQSRPEVQRKSSGRPQETYEQSQPKPKKYKHESGVCDICDNGGYHTTVPKDPPRSSSRAPAPLSPQKSRPPMPMATEDDHSRPSATRRSSSAPRGQRPMSMYASMPVQYQYQQFQTMPLQSPIIYTQPLSTPLGYTTTPMTPTMPYSPAYTYVTTPMAAAPQATYIEHVPASYEYFEQKPVPVPDIRPPNPKRRSATYGPPVIKHASDGNTSRPRAQTSDHEQRLAPMSHKSSQNQDRDRVIMGPPPRPEIGRRPSLRKTTTYTPTTTADRRRSIALDDQEIPPLPPLPPTPSRERHTSPSRPPTSYRGPHMEPERPSLPPKSQTYSSTPHTTKITAADRAAASTGTGLPRRTTLPTPLTRERHEDEAEAYQRNRRSLTSDDLISEAIRKKGVFSKLDPSERSETGSSKSQKSRGSGSRASSGAGTGGGHGKTQLRVGNMTITTEGPVSVDRNGNVHINKTGMVEERTTMGQKRIERAPSVTSRTSKVSAHSGSVVSNSAGKRASVGIGLGRRSSRPVEDNRPQLRDDCAIRDDDPGREEYYGQGLGGYAEHEEYDRRPRANTRESTRRNSSSRPASIVGRGSIERGQRGGSNRHDY